MAADIIKMVSVGHEANVADCSFDCLVDVRAEDVVTGAVMVVCRDGGGVFVVGVGHDVVHSVG